MQNTNETARREITINGVVLKVIAPYAAGHTLSDEEANVLNQTLAENLRNNFATRVKEVKEKAGSAEAVDVASLQEELDNYINEYEFGARRQAGVAVDPVTRIALVLAREAVRKALTKGGKNIKDYTADQINEIATRAIDTNPRFRELATEQYELKKKAAAETFTDIAA